jgi:hypothetical protein
VRTPELLRYAVLADVHGDVAALRAVLHHLRRLGVLTVVYVGDLLDCRVSKRDVPGFVFSEPADVFDPDPALIGLVGDAVLIRGNQEERISELVPDEALPGWVRPVLTAPVTRRTGFAELTHGHTLPWRELSPGVWCPAGAPFTQSLLVHGHHHRNALRRREGDRVTDVPAPPGVPVRLEPDAQYIANVGPVRGADPSWLLVDEADRTVTYHRCEAS